MIIDYDHNPNITTDQKVQSLQESVQMALNENDTEHRGFRALFDKVNATIDSIKKLLTKILNRIDNMYHLETVTATGTVGANTNAIISANYPTVSGYTPIGIIDVRNSAGANITITEFALVGAVARVVARNLSTSSISVTMTMTVLYIPS